METVVSSSVAFDVVEDPLKCPLDLGHFADAGSGLKVLLDSNENNFAPKFSIRTKPVPGVDLFDVKPDFSVQLKLKTFLTPFQRFQVKIKTVICWYHGIKPLTRSVYLRVPNFFNDTFFSSFTSCLVLIISKWYRFRFSFYQFWAQMVWYNKDFFYTDSGTTHECCRM